MLDSLNDWYDHLPEPKRALIFLVPTVLALVGCCFDVTYKASYTVLLIIAVWGASRL